MRRRDVFLPVLMVPVGFVGYRALAAGRKRPVVELMIATDGDLLAFKPTELSCPTGAQVRLTFIHTGKYIRQEHDWVLTVPGATSAVAMDGLKAGESTGYLKPGDRRVLAATRLCGKGEQVSVEFIAPAPGDYPFLCSYPGHDEFMRGVLHVTQR
jgi:azurin